MTLTRKLYSISGHLSAVFLAGIGVLILAQVGARFMGSQIPSADDFAAWCMAASVFLALPSTFLRGDHIRVTLLFGSVSPKLRFVMDVLSTVIAIVLLGWGVWYVGEYVYESYVYHDVSQGIIAVPLWIPQCAMLVGMSLMLMAFIERLVSLFYGDDILEVSEDPALVSDEPSPHQD